ncbi:MAG: hypothetical protein K1X74_05600 [Pirellulales bacterium]|nr:hypothetical protein [Pirellulales bacterium]
MRASTLRYASLGAIVLALGAALVATQAADQPQPAKHFKGLGDFRRTVSTSSPEAQQFFDQGLCFLFAFNHDEAIRSFTEAARLDPHCAMAHWGIALANGPHINNPVVPPPRAEAAWAALAAAQREAPPASPVERALIEALGARYAHPQPEDRAPLDAAYADAMRKVWQSFPDDADVGALFAEALMDLRPWDQWTPQGQPQPGTEEVLATLDKVVQLNPRQPLALHLYIHAVEASPEPGRALEAADRLRDLQPGLGHLVHMPSHIDVRCGRWAEAVVANRKAIVADAEYRAESPQQDFYRLYMAHNYHMLAFAAIMRGQSQLAYDTVRAMLEAMPEPWIAANPYMADGFHAMPIEILVRFGRWDDVLAAPEPAQPLKLARALRHAARGVAFAAQGKLPEAEAAQAAIRAAAAEIPEDGRMGNNSARDVAAVAEHLLAGEVLYRAGKVDAGFAELRRAIELEDALRYDEPPSWIHPVRHALGAILLAEGREEEAAVAYQEDLKRWPNNGWSLYGLARCYRRLGKQAEAARLEEQFAGVWRDADVKLPSSCYCQPEK